MTWRVGTVTDLRDETATARTLVLDVPDWPGSVAGQHVDVRLTAPDGYTATRSYSISSAPDPSRVEITVEGLPDGEVSSYLVGGVAVGDQLELRGPVGGWFVWRPEQAEPVQLVAGGSGLAPLMSMLRARTAARGTTPMRLLSSVRAPDAVLYADELRDRAAAGTGRDVTLAFTRTAPEGAVRRPGRVDADLVAAVTLPAADRPTCYVCGPTGFVEAAADLLVRAGHDPARVRTERFGPSGGSR